MQTQHRFVGQVSCVTLACSLATGVTTTATLSGCVALGTALHVGAPARFVDVHAAWPKGVPGGSFAALWPHLAYQRTDASCSVASVTTVVNALRAAAGHAPVDQADVVATDPSGGWARDTQNGGQGMDLDAVHLRALAACSLLGDVPRDRRVGVQAVHVPASGSLAEAKQALEFALGRMVARPTTTFLLVNFEQRALVARGAPEGHLSVVGGWDERRGQVLILDVDSDRLPPYWVPIDALLAAMQRPDDVTGQPRGYLTLWRDVG